MASNATALFNGSTAKSVMASALDMAASSGGRPRIPPCPPALRASAPLRETSSPPPRSPPSFVPPHRVQRQTTATAMSFPNGVSAPNHADSFANAFFWRQSRTSHRTRKPMAEPTSHGVAASVVLCTKYIIDSTIIRCPQATRYGNKLYHTVRFPLLALLITLSMLCPFRVTLLV